MEESELTDALNRAASIVLEEWAMAFLSEGSEAGIDTPLEASVIFNGDIGVSGTVSLVASQKLAEAICRSVLGVADDEELDIVSRIDALKEMVNLVGGHFLTQAYGTTPVFQLSAPECKVLSDGGFAPEGYSTWLSADDEPVGLKVVIHP